MKLINFNAYSFDPIHFQIIEISEQSFSHVYVATRVQSEIGILKE